jgi:polyisoprenoid-binding protein YceI
MHRLWFAVTTAATLFTAAPSLAADYKIDPNHTHIPRISV